jgi:dienelactone hydrolase
MPINRRLLSFGASLRQVAHSKLLWRALVVLLFFEGLAAIAWLGFFLRWSPNHLMFGVAFMATQLLALTAFLCGGRAEQQRMWFSRLRHVRESRRSYYEMFHVAGDPTLARRVQALRPSRPFAALTSPEQMSGWRESTRHEIIGGLYQEAFARDEEAPSIRVLHEVGLEAGMSRAFVTYEASDGTTIPAYLFRPESHAPLPAVFVIPGSGRGIVETAGLVRSYQNAAALALAKAGFVTLTPELRGSGHLGQVLGTDRERVVLNALLAGSSYSALIVNDLRRGLTALSRHQAVDPTRVAVSGCSLGADLAITLGALDTRACAVVAQGLFPWHGERGQRPTSEENGSAFGRHSCSVIPGEATFAHYEDRFLLLAPRPFAIINGKRDVGNMREEESWLPSLLRTAYRLEEADNNFKFVLSSGGHEYHVAPAIEFLKHHLKATQEGRRSMEVGSFNGARLDVPLLRPHEGG